MAMQVPAEERRNHKRIRSSIGADVSIPGTNNYTHLRNISRSGAFIHSFSQSDYRIGQNVIVTLPSKKEEKIHVVSKIVWMDNDGIGVKFLRYHTPMS